MVKRLRLWLSALLVAAFSTGAFAEDATVTFVAGTDLGSSSSGTSSDSMTKDGVTISSTSAVFARTDNYRTYNGGTTTITAPGYITKVVFTATGSNYMNLEETEDFVADTEAFTYTWTGNAESVSITATGTSRFNQIEVTYTVPVVASPTITPETGTYYEAQTVTITGEEGATIEYSIDGGETYTAYSEPFTVSETTTVKAKQTVGEDESMPKTSIITIAPTYTSLAELNAAATSSSVPVQLTASDLLVTYVYSTRTYLTDGTNAILLYGAATGLNAGEKVSGTIQGNITLYNSVPELVITSSSCDLTVNSTDNAVEAITVDAATLVENYSDYANMLVCVKGATLAEDIDVSSRTTTTLTVGETEIAVYNNFTLTYSYTAGVYDVTGIAGGIYSEAKQIFPISEDFMQAVTEEEETTSEGDYAVGDEVTIDGGIYSIASSNLFVNGSFTDGLNGWTSDLSTNGEASTDNTWNETGGYDEGAYVTLTGGGTGGNNIKQLISVTSGSTYYYVVYSKDDKTDVATWPYVRLVTASVTETDGTTTVSTSSDISGTYSVQGTNGEWVKAETIFTASSDYVAQLTAWAGGLNVDGFQLYEVTYVGIDASELDALIASAQEILATYEEGTDWYTSLSEAIATAEAAEPTTADEVSAATTTLQEAIDAAAAAKALAEAAATAPIENGSYYIMNVETGYYVGAGNSWGTQASLLARPQTFVAELQADGTYTLSSYIYNSATQHFLGSNGYTDTSVAYWTIAEGTEEGQYSLSIAGTGYLTAGETGAALSFADVADDATPTQWKFVSITEGMENATVEAPVNVSGLVQNPDFKRNGNSSYNPTWTVTSYDGTAAVGNYTEKANSTYNYNIVESWKSSNGVKIEQTLTDLPAGLYALTGQGSDRNYDDSTNPQAELYAGEESVTFPPLYNTAIAALTVVYDSIALDPSWQAIDTVYFRVNEGDSVNIGVRNEYTNAWTTFTHTTLLYLGDNSLIENFLPELKDSLLAAIDSTATAVSLPVNDADTQTALAEAIAAAQNMDYTTAKRSTITEAIAALEAAVAAVEASNAEFAASHPADGDYLIQNVETGYYLGGGNYWGTQASTLGKPQWLGLAAQSDGTYQLDSYQTNGGTAHYLNVGGYLDNGSPSAITITEVEDGVYTLYVDGGGYITSTGKNNAVDMAGTDATAAAAQWKLITMDDVLTEQATATAEAPVDMTALIYNPEMKRNLTLDVEGLNQWTTSSYDGTASANNFTFGGGGAIANVAESYHSSNGFKVQQTLPALTAGVYSLDAQAFYRQDGSDTENLPIMFFNDEQTTLSLLTGSENSMAAAYASFLEGTYPTETLYLEVAEGDTVTIGFQSANTSTWNIFGELTLKYYGTEADIDALKNAALLAQLEELRATATEYAASENVSDAVKTTVNDALTATAEVESTEDALNEAIATLTTANAAAKESEEQKASIDGMKELLASTNVVTADAYTTYSGLIDTYEAAWNEGTLTATVLNPYELNGWHASLDYDDFLLSAWTINEVQATDYNTSLYINTWSTEGLYDGTDFVVPFFEYWTGDATSLGTATIEAVITGLAAGTYDVTVDVRVRLNDTANSSSETPTGITFTANDASADATAGENVDGTQFYIQTITATATVGDDGTLTIAFNVEDTNNISWLSFQNVNYDKTTGVDAIEAETGATTDYGYTLSGARAQKNTRGIVIVNGKKVLVK